MQNILIVFLMMRLMFKSNAVVCPKTDFGEQRIGSVNSFYY